MSGEVMRLIQWLDGGERGVGVVGADGVARRLRGVSSVYEVALLAIRGGEALSAFVAARAEAAVDYARLLAEGAVLPPIDHPDPARMMVSGTGLTHLGSAKTRDDMHAKDSDEEAPLTDSMRMFRMGVEGGKPPPSEFFGAQPEWFYKGDGECVVAPGGAIELPDYASDGGEEPEIAGVYVIDDDGAPCRVGFALGNEYSDHVMERVNYLWLAHSKLRQCAVGPELLLGALPPSVSGTSAVRRDGEVVWEKPFYSGEENMCHSIANLERHHFKYDAFCVPGSVHVHFFGTATLSFADGVSVREGDEFVIESPVFGRALTNRVRARQGSARRDVRAL